ncbi:hypothetical protein [uncultured Clostridium sp.]|uniref:hypothetical protein n=1 Tax=uncultured Clostridium sp. TaxID=59620 RepID=UPI0026726964|nr:hypothetical protein [uncultured Clostridium sp.]
MKKKLLSLVLAGAMVASTSVSAFAETTYKDTTIQENEQSKDVEIGITGNVLDDAGNKVPGTISVTVPTTTSFTVNEKGKVISSDMVIRNNSDEKLVVVASKFEDSNGPEKINIIKKTEFGNDASAKNKGTIWLRLTGSTNNIGLTSEANDSSNGKMYNSDYTNSVDGTEQEIGKINEKGIMTLKLEGEGGTNGNLNNPIKDDFKLILKVKRER